MCSETTDASRLRNYGMIKNLTTYLNLVILSTKLIHGVFNRIEKIKNKLLWLFMLMI